MGGADRKQNKAQIRTNNEQIHLTNELNTDADEIARILRYILTILVIGINLF